MLVNATLLLKDAAEKRYAIGGFDSTCYPLTEAILRAAEESGKPLFVMVPPFAYGRPYDAAFNRHLAERCRDICTPVTLHLDHAETFEEIRRAIDAGFTSVMIDASMKPYEQNVELTQKVVTYAHSYGVSVEAEIGHVGGGEAKLTPAYADQSGYTDPQQAAAFAMETGVDMLAVAFGTVHGSFLGTPKLDLERLAAIRRLLPLFPLVMHGGSGLSDEDFVAAVKAGINKVNVFSEISTLYTAEIAKTFSQADGKLHLHKAMISAEDAVVQAICHLMDLFGTPVPA